MCVSKARAGTVPGNRVTGAEAHTEFRENITTRRYKPEVGAVCPNWARTDLSGGREVTRVPTANIGRRARLAFYPGRVNAPPRQMRRIVFSIAFFRKRLPVQSIPISTKSEMESFFERTRRDQGGKV